MYYSKKYLVFSNNKLGISRTNVESFTEILPFNPNTSRILIKDHAILAAISVSPNDPTVNILTPNGGETIDGIYEILWTGMDSDGDSLRYDVNYSIDGGNTWMGLVDGLTDTRFEWDSSHVPGSSNALIRVLASDGVNTGIDDSDSTFSVVQKMSSSKILSPDNNSIFNVGENISFTAAGFSSDFTPLEDDSIIWVSNKDGILGTGSRLILDDLSFGIHNIYLDLVSETNIPQILRIQIVSDDDFDGINHTIDNCPNTFNPDQNDSTNNGIGDACDQNYMFALFTDELIVPPDLDSDSIPNPSNEIYFPKWLKNISAWWAEGLIDDSEFLSATQYLINRDIIKIPPTEISTISDEIPNWIKTNANWWADDKIKDGEYAIGLQWMIEKGFLSM